jgi:predicted RNase H-like nuclease (RuvC/YqgF family)
MALQTIKAYTLASQATKTFEKCFFWRNIPIRSLPRVIFQLKNKIKNEKKKIYIFFKKILKIEKLKKLKIRNKIRKIGLCLGNNATSNTHLF